MKTIRIALLFSSLTFAFATPPETSAQSTAFTYQGRLADSNGVVTGLQDFEFRLFNALTGGAQQGSTITLNDLGVTNGLFVTPLDFGANFPGADRFLQISVRPGASAGAYANLSPRQPITSTPYAVTARGISGTLPAGQLPSNVALTDRAQTFSANQTFQTPTTFNSRVGIGTNIPQQALHVAGSYARVDGSGDEQATLGGDGAGGDVELGSSNPGVGAVALFNQASGDYMHLFAKGATFFGPISGDGSGLTALPAGQLSGSLADALLSPNVALRSGGNSFTGNQSITGGNLVFGDGNASVLFPAVNSSSAPMIHMFSGGTENSDRMVLAHSPAFASYGLQYQDSNDQFNFVGAGFPVMSVQLSGGGRVGVGTGTPQSRLDVIGEIRGSGGANPGVTGSSTGGNGVQGIATSGNGVQGTSSSASASGVYGENTGGGGYGVIGRATGAGYGIYGDNANPASWAGVFNGNLYYSGFQNKLDVGDNFVATIRAGDLSFGHSSRRGTPGRALVDFSDTLHLNFDSDWAKTVIGGDNVSVCTLTIRGGCDIAEPFKMSDAEIPKGAVVVIDENNPGHLRMSDQACDRRVAGIISGANGVNTGVTLTQEGVFENGQNVALSGRVYVQADTANGPIVPGDLLTTSETPGHAMKVTDHAKSQGAILGKAMTPLKDGKGMVLVLVTLQ